ncbi:hypothetical protein D5086_024486 [Populus alba]|uniref:Uncharacterized protein n=1 Tax=Populus alba TaxID=43335 RepID=A0ACC4B7F9_POPAL
MRRSVYTSGTTRRTRMDTLRDLWVSRFRAGNIVVEGGKSSVGVADRTEQRAWCCSGNNRLQIAMVLRQSAKLYIQWHLAAASVKFKCIQGING